MWGLLGVGALRGLLAVLLSGHADGAEVPRLVEPLPLVVEGELAEDVKELGPEDGAGSRGGAGATPLLTLVGPGPRSAPSRHPGR